MARRRKRRHHQEENHERWLVSYADFITLMFAFFIVLYATSERNAQKTQEFERSIKKFFVNATAVIAGNDGDGIDESKKGHSPIKPPIPTSKYTSDEAAVAMGEIEGFLEQNLSKQERETFLIDLSYDTYGVRVALNASKLFAKNSVKFERSGLKALDTVSHLLKTMGSDVVVESHVNSSNFRPKPYDSDWKLSASRSSQVVEYMIRRHSFESERLAAMAHGSERPIYPKGDPSEEKNQRLEFLVVTGKSPF